MAKVEVKVIGAGLAGSEAAWQIARRGIPVTLYEMRPVRPTPVHRGADFAELVCSNSLKSLELSTPHGLLKEEMASFGSMILDCALAERVPAGGALAVDRDRFAAAVTRTLLAEPHVTVVREEVVEIPSEGVVVIATGPLVADRLAEAIARFTGSGYLHFFDAIAPVVEADSIDREVAFAASRYGKGDGADYLNCPMTREEYERFVAELSAGEKAHLHEHDTTPYFEGCLPIEELARRGIDTLRFGPMKPVGLRDPRTGERPWAVVQLRQDDLAAEHWSMVGFQTQLRWPEQKRIFATIPGLARAEFVRLGQVHRNCYINAPRVLLPTLQTRERPTLLFAGQISGVEGYTESAATGMLAGINAARLVAGKEPLELPRDTMLGALTHYIAHADAESYQPTNAAFGLLPETPSASGKKKDRREARSARALASLRAFLEDERESLLAHGPA